MEQSILGYREFNFYKYAPFNSQNEKFNFSLLINIIIAFHKYVGTVSQRSDVAHGPLLCNFTFFSINFNFFCKICNTLASVQYASIIESEGQRQCTFLDFLTSLFKSILTPPPLSSPYTPTPPRYRNFQFLASFYFSIYFLYFC